MARRLTTEQFIEKAKLVHGEKYNYTNVEYSNSHNKVKILCSKHGAFEQSPNNHLSGKGCYLCSLEYKSELLSKDVSLFIDDSNRIHNNKYDYTSVDYINSKVKVKIICPEHGLFTQSPEKHLFGHGCRKCANKLISSLKTKKTFDLINQSIKTHGDKYDYSLVEYKDAKTKIKIICPTHGVFEQIPDNHINGSGCYHCGRDRISRENQIKSTGWSAENWGLCASKSKNFDSFKVYIIKCWNDNEEFYKIGRTFTKVSYRFKTKKSMPYQYEILNEFIFDDALSCFERENYLKRQHKEFKYKPRNDFHGMHECFFKINLDI